MIKTGFSAKEKEKASSGGGYASTVVTNITNVTSASVADKLKNKVDIWGNDFDGSQNVDGNLVMDKNQKILLDGEFSVKSYYNPDSKIEFDEAENVASRSKITSNKVDFQAESSDFEFVYNDNNSSVKINDDGIEVHGNASLTSPTVITNVLDSTGSNILVQKPLTLMGGLDLTGKDLKLKNLESENITNSDTIKTKDLVVSGNAHFFNLVIDEVKHAGGQLMLSPGNFHIDKIEVIDTEYVVDNVNVLQHNCCGRDEAYKVVRLYQIANDGDDVINNTIQANDHVFCWTTNIKNSNLTRNYWTAVLGCADGVLTEIEGENKYCNYIDIVYKVKYNNEWVNHNYGEVKPRVGDNLAVLGSLSTDRQSAIIMAAYESPDIEVEAPCIAQYAGINSWSFSDKRTTYFSKNKNRIQGELHISSGENVEDYLSGIENGKTSYVHIAYANSADGSQDFTKDSTQIENPMYIGFATNFVDDDTALVYSDYKWSALRDENEQVINNKLYSVRERLYLSSDDILHLDLCYDITSWNKHHTILCTIYRVDGSHLNIQLSSNEQDGRTFMSSNLVLQSNWSQLDKTARYIYMTVQMIDNQNNVVDSHFVEVDYEANATLAITDSIKARVSDAEGNISQLQIDSDSILARVQMLESEVSGESGEAGSVIERVAQLEIDVDSITGVVSEHTTQLNNVNNSLETVSEKVSEIEQTVDSINLSVSEKTYGGVNILNGADFVKDFDKSVFDYINPLCTWIDKPVLSDYGGLSLITNSNTVFNSANYIEMLRWKLNGKMKPDTWYTLSFYMKNVNGGILTYVYAPNLSQNVSYGTEERYVDGVKKSIAGDNAFEWTASSVYTKHVYTFKTNGVIDQNTNIFCLFRARKVGSVFPQAQISLVKLEEGQVATAFDISPKDVNSKIELQADEINLNIQNGLINTGINI